MLTFNSHPCKEQRKVMEDLGFELESTEDRNISCWSLGGLTLDYDNDQVLKPLEIISDAIVNARCQGAEEFKTKFRELIGVASAQALLSVVDRR